jgi:hypothetical protein
VVQGLDSWLSLSESKASVSERPQAHGAFDPGTDWRQSGVFALTVAYVSDSYADTVTAIRSLTGLGALDGLVTLVVSDDSGVTTRMVSIRKIDVPDLHTRSSVGGIAVDLLAPDPFAYGPSVESSTGLPAAGGGVQFPMQFPADFGVAGDDGRAVFTNTGTAPTPLKFKVSGGMSDGFSLRCVETGDTLTFMRPLDVSDYVLLDSSDASVLLNGVSPVSGFLIQDDWWTVPPGGTCTVQFNAIGVVYGVPTLELSGAPAYF